jgi:exodeoxyribonuclease-3
MRIATLNIRQGGGKRIFGLTSFVGTLNPDCLLLTEFRNNQSGRELSAELTNLGFSYQTELSGDPRINQLRWFSKHPFEAMHLTTDRPELGRLDHRVIGIEFAGLSLIGVYFPQRKLKAPFFEYLHSTFNADQIGDAVLMGDFNTGLHGTDEQGKTFFCTEGFERLLKAGWVDAWRARNPDAREYSWFSNKGNGFRIDHALCTEAMDRAISSVSYRQDTLSKSISDHACLLMDLTITVST